MAFSNAAGYSNLSQGNFVPEIYSQKVLKFFRRSSVVEDITNTDYYGEIEDFGDTVRVINEPTITVSSYNRGAVINTQNLDDNQFTLTVDTANAFAFKIDDIEERHSHLNFEALATSSGAYSLKRKYDRDVLEAIQGASGINTGTAVTPSGSSAGDTVVNAISEAARILDDNEVPEEGRWMVAPPKLYEVLKTAGSKFLEVQVTGMNESPLLNGKVLPGPVHGFNLYKSTALNLSGTDIITATGTSNQFKVLFGHISSVATASHIAKTEVVRDTDSFADIIRGLHVYGQKVLRTEAVVRTLMTMA